MTAHTHTSRIRPSILFGTPTRFATAGFITLLLLGALSCFTGCKSAPKPVTSNGPVQGTLNPDGTFTPAPNQPAQPQPGQPQPGQPAQQGVLQSDGTYAPAPGTRPAPAPPTNVASAPQPVAPPPSTVAAPPPRPQIRTIPAGTPVTVTLTQTLSASHNEVGDTFTGVLAQPISFRGGTAFARGTRVTGTVAAAKGRGRFAGAGDLGITLTSIGGVRVNTSEYERAAKGRGKRSAGFIGGGAGLGALIGGLAGGGKGAAIGALAGGGGGTAAAAYTGDRDVVIPSESTVTFRLTSPVQVR